MVTLSPAQHKPYYQEVSSLQAKQVKGNLADKTRRQCLYSPSYFTHQGNWFQLKTATPPHACPLAG